MSEGDGNQGEIPEDALQKRQLNLDAMLGGMGGFILAQETDFPLKPMARLLIDAYRAQRRLPKVGWTRRGPVAASLMVDAQ
jgi:hypothetical protein